jgi:hypothetical protein
MAAGKTTPASLDAGLHLHKLRFAHHSKENAASDVKTSLGKTNRWRVEAKVRGRKPFVASRRAS